MGDLISRQATVKAIEQHKTAVLEGHKWDEGIEYGYAAAHRHLVDIIEQLPSAQPEIVRCKDCKHSRFFDPCFYCYEMGGEVIVPENGFCFKAERRNDE